MAKKRLPHNPTDKDYIVDFLLHGGETELSPRQQAKLARLQKCADLIKEYGSRLAVVPRMVKLFSFEDPKYNDKAAYADFEDTQEIFGTTPQSSRDFWVDIVLGFMIETRNKANRNDDVKTAAVAEKNMVSLIKDFMGDKEAYNMEELQLPAYQFGFFPELLKVDLPENWESQVKALIADKKKKNLGLADIEEAQIINEWVRP